MKTMKKLSIAVVVLAMCLLLGVTVLAVDSTEVVYSAEFDKEPLCVSDSKQTITLTVTTNTDVEITAFDASVTAPEGWKITDVTNDFVIDSDMNALSDREWRIAWHHEDTDNVKTNKLAVITIEIPAGATANEYEIVFTINDIARAVYEGDVLQDIATWEEEKDIKADFSLIDHSFTTKPSGSIASEADCENAAQYYVQCDNCDVVSADKKVSVGEAKGHAWGTPSYEFSADGKTCTAKRVCATVPTHEQEETVNTTGVEKTPATCVAMGVTTYTANFEAAWAVDGQTKDVQDIAINADNHAYPATPSSYTDNGDGTHTANYVCGNDANHIEKKDPVAHTYDQEDGTKCVCGATKPVTTVVKGDIDLDGDVDSDDLTLLARHVGGIEVITDTAVLANANVNGDGGVDSDDLTKHARYVGGIITDWSQE